MDELELDDVERGLPELAAVELDEFELDVSVLLLEPLEELLDVELVLEDELVDETAVVIFPVVEELDEELEEEFDEAKKPIAWPLDDPEINIPDELNWIGSGFALSGAEVIGSAELTEGLPPPFPQPLRPNRIRTAHTPEIICVLSLNRCNTVFGRKVRTFEICTSNCLLIVLLNTADS